MSEKVWQEFYCGECVGYIHLSLNMNLNHEFWFVCPKCGHKHRRVIRDGVILENGRYKNEPSFELVVTMAAYSKKPWTAGMAKNVKKERYSARRDGVVIDKDSERSAFSSQYFKDRWHERFGGDQNQ